MKYFSKPVRAKLINTVPSNELILRYNFVYRMVFEERKTWNSVVTSWGVATERNQKKHGLRKVPCMLRRTVCYTHTAGL